MCRMVWWSFLSWFDVIDLLLTNMCAKNNFYIFVPSDLDLWPLYRKFAPLSVLIRALVCLSCCAAGPIVRYCGQWMAAYRAAVPLAHASQLSLPRLWSAASHESSHGSSAISSIQTITFTWCAVKNLLTHSLIYSQWRTQDFRLGGGRGAEGVRVSPPHWGGVCEENL